MYASPVFTRETRIHFWKLKVYLLRMLYILIVGVLFLVILPSRSVQDRVGELYTMIFWLMTIAALFLGPAFSSATISVEKQKNTLGLLFLTDLSPGEIVVGKFFSRFAYMALMILSVLPILILGVGLGGVTYKDVFAVMMIVTALLFLACACAVFFSVLLKRNIMVMIFTYIVLFVLVGLPAAFGERVAWASAPSA